MNLAGFGRTVKRSDHVMPDPPPGPCLPRGSALDVRLWRQPEPGEPLLLVTTPRKAGIAVRRNQFRRRVRMAFQEVLKDVLPPPRGFVMWVRPGRGARCGFPLGYADILSLLRQAMGPAGPQRKADR